MINEPILDLNVQAVDPTPLAEESQFSAWCAETLQYGQIDNAALHEHVHWQITLRIVDEKEGQMLNLNYRKKDYPTNVLSFYYGDPFAELEFSDDDADLPEDAIGQGDIVICAPVVIQEALTQKKSILEHTAHLTVHATLHLLGYDHETKEDASIMEALEITILRQLGFNNPYEEI